MNPEASTAKFLEARDPSIPFIGPSKKRSRADEEDSATSEDEVERSVRLDSPSSSGVVKAKAADLTRMAVTREGLGVSIDPNPRTEDHIVYSENDNQGHEDFLQANRFCRLDNHIKSRLRGDMLRGRCGLTLGLGTTMTKTLYV